jgi:Tfp pilus assembly protein FimT
MLLTSVIKRDRKDYKQGLFIKELDGITLIELVVAMTIVGFLVLLAAPDLSNTMKKSRVQDCANRLAADIKMARTKAQAEGQRAMIVVSKNVLHDFNGNGKTEHYFMFLDRNPRNGAYDGGATPETVITEVACNNNVIMETSSDPLPNCDPPFANAQCMQFTTLGTLPSDETGSTILMGYGDYKARIKVVSMTGYLEIQWSEDNGATWHAYE